MSALHYAAANGHAAIAALLVAAGASVHAPALDGTPLGIATRRFDEQRSKGDARGAPEVVRELLWLPAVRLLWVGHLKPNVGQQHLCDRLTQCH